jgi:hypothetical protein
MPDLLGVLFFQLTKMVDIKDHRYGESNCLMYPGCDLEINALDSRITGRLRRTTGSIFQTR